MIGAFQRLGRSLLLMLARLVFRPGKPSPISLPRLRHVLVIRTDPRVGNVLLTTPLLRALKQGLPGATVALLLARGKEPLVEGLPFIDERVPFEKTDFFRAPWRFLALLVRLRRAHFDAAIDASHWHAFSFTSAFLTLWTGAPVRIGHRRGEAARFLTHPVDHDPARTNEVDAKLELLKPLGIPAAGTELETRLGRLGPKVEALLTGKLPTSRFAALNIGARKPDHRWAPENFGALAERLAAKGLVPLVLWGPGERDVADQVVAASHGQAILGPATDLEELAACFRVASVVVANDTGPMHLACAVGANVVCCYLAEDGERWGHPGPRFEGVKVRTEAEPVAAVEAALWRLVVTEGSAPVESVPGAQSAR